MAELSSRLMSYVECPACHRPAARARHLFATQMSGTACSVRKCDCGLTFKAAVPSNSRVEAIYSDSYQHFEIVQTDEAFKTSAKEKLERCLRMLSNRVPNNLLKI